MTRMEKQDARTLTSEQLTELRRRGNAAAHNGESPDDVALILGVSRAAPYTWLALCFTPFKSLLIFRATAYARLTGTALPIILYPMLMC